MHATLVLLVALGGLGAQNASSELPPIPPAVVQPAPEPAAPTTAYIPGYDMAPPGYPGCSSAVCGDDRDPYSTDTPGRFLRDTFCSFVIGRDPDVPSARQIQAAYCAGYYNR